MSALKHSLTTCAVCSGKNSILAVFIEQENTSVIKIELFTNYVGKNRQERLEILIGCCRTRHLGDSFELLRTAFVTLVCRFQLKGPAYNTLFQVLIQILKAFVGSD